MYVCMYIAEFYISKTYYIYHGNKSAIRYHLYKSATSQVQRCYLRATVKLYLRHKDATSQAKEV